MRRLQRLFDAHPIEVREALRRYFADGCITLSVGPDGSYVAEGRFLPLVALGDPVLSSGQGPQKTAWYTFGCAGSTASSARGASVIRPRNARRRPVRVAFSSSCAGSQLKLYHEVCNASPPCGRHRRSSMGPTPTLPSDFVDLLAEFADADVRYLVIGGLCRRLSPSAARHQGSGPAR